jgi:carboxymethylenebutenolidase
MLESERTFDIRTEAMMGEWMQVGPTEYRAYLATPESGSGPGVLVLHAWWGLTSVFTDVCDRLAAAGFVALAPDLYANGETTDSIAEAEQLVAAHDSAPGKAKAIVDAAVDYLLAAPVVTGGKIGVVGYSMGAYWALQLSQARSDEVSAVVAFYGTDDGDYTTARAAYLGHFAENDDFEPLEAVRALETSIRDAGREVAFHIYPGTGHWFVEPNRPDVYNAEAAALAWERTLAFLNAQLA